MNELTLASLPPGQSAQIAGLEGTEAVKRRLMEIGLIPGQRVETLRQAPLGDPIEVQVMHYHLTLRKAQADFVKLEALPENTPAAATATTDETTSVPAVASEDFEGQINQIALLGNPNSGKTSLFNALTGLRQKVGNYPGVTVEKRVGSFPHQDRFVEVLDLPGTYSLNPNSPDERVTTNVLQDKQEGVAQPDALVLVLDACNLARNLYIFTQSVDLQLPTVVALSMYDIADKEGIQPDLTALEQLLGVPVVAVNGQRGIGVDKLKAALDHARVPQHRAWTYLKPVQEASHRLGLRAEEHNINPGHLSYDVFGERLLCGAQSIIPLATTGHEEFIKCYERELRLLQAEGIDINDCIIRARYDWIQRVCRHVLPAKAQDVGSQSLDKFSLALDSLLVHKFFGLIIFVAIMAAVFISVFMVAAPIMDGFEAGIEFIAISLFGGMAEGPLKDLIMNGIFAGVGGVVVFVPQIAIISLFLALLEDSGYLARASFLMDRLLAGAGLHGKSFIPLLTSHACAIPGILAARNMEHHRDRLATILVAPFMSCSARLPVYALLITVLFYDVGYVMQGLILLSLYLLGILAAVVTAWLAKKTALKGPSPAFIMEFPAYRMPQWIEVARVVGRNSWLFCRKAGTIILAFTICLWAMLYYPRLDDGSKAEIAQAQGLSIEDVERLAPLAEQLPEEGAALSPESASLLKDEHDADIASIEKAIAVKQLWSGAQTRNSIAGTAGHIIEPVITPMGYDWKIGVGLIGAFAAREVFVATMGTVYSVGDEVDENTLSLHQAMKADTRSNGEPLWTIPLGVSVLVFFVIAMQCISTVAVVRQETNSWRWPIFQLLYMNALAYVLAALVYQIGTALT